jgi:hypothetical protein
MMETCNVPALDGTTVDVFIDAIGNAPSSGCAIFTHEFRGAATRVPEGATAFGLRREHVLVEILATWAKAAGQLEERRHQTWARMARRSFGAAALPQAYVNLLGSSDDRASASYGGAAPRLASAKARYDPDNVFRSAIPLPVAGQEQQVRAALR